MFWPHEHKDLQKIILGMKEPLQDMRYESIWPKNFKFSFNPQIINSCE